MVPGILFWAWVGPIMWGSKGFGTAGNVFTCLIGVPLAALTMAFLVSAVRKRRRFGSSVFQMARTPFEIGGPLAGTVRVDRGVASASMMEVELYSVLHRWRTGPRRSDSRTWEHVLFTTKTEVRGPFPSSGGRTRIAVCFDVPSDGLETGSIGVVNDEMIRDRVEWRLRVTSADAQYSAEFEVPVFDTSYSGPRPSKATLDAVSRFLATNAVRSKDDSSR